MILTIRLRMPAGLTEQQAETISHSALADVKRHYADVDHDQFEVDWFDLSETA